MKDRVGLSWEPHSLDNPSTRDFVIIRVNTVSLDIRNQGLLRVSRWLKVWARLTHSSGRRPHQSGLDSAVSHRRRK